MRVPISTKLIVITILLLVGVSVPIAIQSSKYFEKVSIQREEDTNMRYAAARSLEVESLVNAQYEKAKTLATELFQTHNNPSLENRGSLINKDKSWAKITVLKLDGANPTLLEEKFNNEFLDANKIKPLFFQQLRQAQAFPMRELAEGQIAVQSGNIKVGNWPLIPVVTIGFPLVKDTDQRITHLAIVDLHISVLQKPFTEITERTFYLTDSKGQLLAHQDEKLIVGGQDIRALPLVQAALDPNSPTRKQRTYSDPSTRKEFIGAFVKSSFGLIIYSQIDSDVILEPSRAVKRDAFFILGLVLSGAILLVFIFSMSLTSPLETLVSLISLVSKGNFDVKANEKIKSLFRDEVAELAIAFDKMTEGLKERDKVKNLFSKFHGSSVAEDLINSKVGLGGQNREVIVFFSDIRGFTSFSERRPPEEVVEMLNAYFGLMVKIINENGGVVDKFIGDAIMAVWGAPKAGPNDAGNAVTACLEMRKALVPFNEKRIAKGQPPITVGMGLHAGRAISGTIGSDERMEYTVIGNTVNTASRIEASTKAFGADLLVSDEVVKKAGPLFATDLAGAAEVKGRSEALKLYKVRGFKDAGGKITEVVTPYSDYEAEKADKVKIAS